MSKYSKALDLLLKDENSIKEVLKIVRNNELCIQFAFYCIKRVEHLSSKRATKRAIKAIERWILNPSEKNNKIILDIGDCVINDYDNDIEEYIAMAVWYTMIAIRHHRVTHYTNYVACYAAVALEDSEEEERYHQIQYLKQLLLDKMPEKDKGWFVELMVNAG